MKKKLGLAVLMMAALAMSSFGAEEFNYVMSQAPGQLALLMHREPIVKVLQRKDLDPETRAKLERVLDIKKYAEGDVGLVHNKSYSIYKKLDREALTYNLTAAPKLSLEPLRWKFPVVGEVPYLGFFKKSDADKKEAELKGKGYDVYVRTAGAYSMLGIVADPVYSTMLKYPDAELANTIIHELTHGTVWSKQYTDFNENLALFVGNQGAVNYCADRFGKDSAEVKYAIGSNHDDLLFQQYLAGLAAQLKELYARKDLSDADKLKKREEIFAATKEDFAKNWMPQMATSDYSRWPKVNLNNATVASRLVYFHDLSLYQKVYEKSGSDLKKTVAFIKNVVNTQPGDPEKNLKGWLENK